MFLLPADPGDLRQELLNINNTTVSGFAFTEPGPPPTPVLLSRGDGAIDLQVVNINTSVGVRLTDTWGVGATLSYSSLEIESEVVNRILRPLDDEAPIREETVALRTTIDDDDTDLAFALGAKYRRLQRPSRRILWEFGAVYRRAPSFRVTPRIDPNVDDLLGKRAALGETSRNELNLPDSYGIGGNVQFLGRTLRLLFDVERILHSNLVDARFEADDTTDPRFGVEYFPPRSTGPTVVLRAGTLLEGASTIRAVYTGTGSFVTERVFAGRDRQSHGVGLAFAKTRLDLAADFADSDNEFVVSGKRKRR